MSHTLTDQRHLDMLKTALGESLVSFLSDDDVIEVMVNPDGKVWADTLSKGKYFTELTLPELQRLNSIKLIASLTQQVVSEHLPEIACELQFASARFQGWVPPASASPTYTIRKKARQIFSLDYYAQEGWLTPEQALFLKAAIRNRRNILIAGSTGSGKTTFANALLQELHGTRDRVIVLEDLPELQVNCEDVVSLRTTETLSMRDLVKGCLRMRPDRIIIGEVRDAAALDLLKAWNTGHPGGICTLHANRADSVISRLEDLILETLPQLPTRLIQEAVDIIIFMQKVGARDYAVTEIREVSRV